MHNNDVCDHVSKHRRDWIWLCSSWQEVLHPKWSRHHLMLRGGRWTKSHSCEIKLSKLFINFSVLLVERIKPMSVFVLSEDWASSGLSHWTSHSSKRIPREVFEIPCLLLYQEHKGWEDSPVSLQWSVFKPLLHIKVTKRVLFVF